MRLKVYLLPLMLLSVLELKTDLLVVKKFKMPVRDIFYTYTIRKTPPPIRSIQIPMENPEVIEYYGNTKGQKGVVAVLSLNGEVYTVKEGELIAKRYRVLKIYSNKVVLKDEEKRKNITVKLKEG